MPGPFLRVESRSQPRHAIPLQLKMIGLMYGVMLLARGAPALLSGLTHLDLSDLGIGGDHHPGPSGTELHTLEARYAPDYDMGDPGPLLPAVTVPNIPSLEDLITDEDKLDGAITDLGRFTSDLEVCQDRINSGAHYADMENNSSYTRLKDAYSDLNDATSSLRRELESYRDAEIRIRELQREQRILDAKATALLIDGRLEEAKKTFEESSALNDKILEEEKRKEAALIRADDARSRLDGAERRYLKCYDDFNERYEERRDALHELNQQKLRRTNDRGSQSTELRGTDTPEMIATKAVDAEVAEGNKLIARIDQYLQDHPHLPPDVAGDLTADRKQLADQLYQLQQMLQRAQSDHIVSQRELTAIQDKITEIKNLHRVIEDELPSERPPRRWRGRRAEDPNDIER